jgi:hypothetical protein
LNTEQDRADLHSSLSSSSSVDILRNSQKFRFIGEVIAEVAPEAAESVSPPSLSSNSASSSLSASSSSVAASGRVVPLEVSRHRMEQAQALRNQLQDLDNWKPSLGMKPAQVAALQTEMAGINAAPWAGFMPSEGFQLSKSCNWLRKAWA